ncbi:ArnT family glycosyltransferase [Plantactinospora sonchi]|uniref:Glycosyltransferase family 39 protein n=1 Tax=Plantactinospora sonchi TaxID=1544735 RepID=A0ABU7RLK5_9ACTN
MDTKPELIDDGPEPGPVDWRLRPVLLMLVVGLALIGFFLVSQAHTITFGAFSHPPLYGRWDPTAAPEALLVLPAGLLLAAVGWFVTTNVRRVPSWLALTLIVGAGVVVAAAVTLVRGEYDHLVRGVGTGPDSPYYTSDIHYVDEFGIRGFAERHPELTKVYNSWNSRTHPPGVLVMLSVLHRLLGPGNPFWMSTAIALLGTLAAVSAWSLGRSLGGERSGRIAAVLFVAAPGPLILAYTILDAVFATFLSTAAAMLVLAVHRLSWRWALAAGAMLGLTTYLTYATVFVTLAATVTVLWQVSGVRRVVRLLGAAAAGGVLVLAVAWALLNFDLWAAYRSVPQTHTPYDPYWIVGSPAAFLIFAGVPLAALGALGLVVRAPGARRAVLPLVSVPLMFVWAALPPSFTDLRPGEVERTWAFLFPLLAAAAAPVLLSWIRGLGARWTAPVLTGLITVSLAQATLLQMLYDTW